MSSDPSPAQFELLRKTFQALDVDHDFSISKEELLRSVQSEDTAAAMLKSMDLNGDGKIDFKEFVQGFNKAQQLTGAIEDDTRTAAEVQTIQKQTKKATNDKLQQIFDFCDVDGSGLISFQETCMAMKFFIGRSISVTEKMKIQGMFKSTGEQLTFEKFKSFIIPYLLSLGVMIKPPPQPLTRQIFSFVDADGSGTVSANEALLALRFLGKTITDADKRAINSLPVFNDGGEVSFETFEANVLPVLMHSGGDGAANDDVKKGAKNVVEEGEKILLDAKLSPEEKVKRLATLHEEAKHSAWLKKCGAYDMVDCDAVVRTDLTK